MIVGIERDWSKVQAIRPSVVWHYVSRCCACAGRGGTPRPRPGETLALAWFSPDALPGDQVPLRRRRVQDPLTGEAVAFIR